MNASGDTSTPLSQMASWPVSAAAGAVADPLGTPLAHYGDQDWQTRVASITKLLVAYTTLIALEEKSLTLAQPAGPPGSTVRHLLAHTSGLPFRGDEPIAPPGQRRIYSNTGFEVLGEVLAAATGIPLTTYLAEAVLEPLGMVASELRGSAAYGLWSTTADLTRFLRELQTPKLLAPATLAEAVTEQFTGLAGKVPGMGRYDPNPWGLGFELKGHKEPHWTAPQGSPATFGHFGGSGTFLWVDPDARLACVVLTNRRFGAWAPPLWAALSADVLERFASDRPSA